MNIQHKTVLITGANRGLGAALVNAALKHEAHTVYAAARNPEQISNKDPRVIPVQLDVCDSNSVNAAKRDIQDLDLLINNAGVLEFGDILEVDESSIERCMDVNFRGMLRTSQIFADKLGASQGAMVNILTLLSLASMPAFSAYNASKAAAWSVHLSLRASLAKRNIDVHGVFPGAIDTAMLAGVEIDKSSAEDVANAIFKGIASGAEDIFPDPMSQAVYEAWRSDHKAVEKQFAQM